VSFVGQGSVDRKHRPYFRLENATHVGYKHLRKAQIATKALLREAFIVLPKFFFDSAVLASSLLNLNVFER